MQRADLDRLKTKQDFLRPIALTAQNENHLAIATVKERSLFGHQKPLTKTDLSQLTRLVSTNTIYLAKTVENPFVSLKMFDLITEISHRFEQLVPDGFFIIVSVSRTFTEELKANAKIAGDSTHGIGEAIDIAGKYMKQYFPVAANGLEKVLRAMQDEGELFFLNEEDATAFWHVARNPTYKIVR